ncbi:MAG: hypothetical protein B7Y95_09170 [Rhizobiales bacterium 32-66-11]|jgi:hypothetical protein|nr:MAG: hypothetical protein B7Y95_09170 [Rhizobiales bacterium 32-66-11]
MPTSRQHARRALDLRPRYIALLFVICLVMVAIPILTHPIPPLSDYVNHLARMHVIASVPGDPDLSRFYFIEWSVIPNLMVDLVVPIFARVMNVYAAGEVFTLATFALIAFGTMLLHRALFGSWSAIALLAFPLLYNSVFLVGVMNYIFGIGLALTALACWILLRDKAWPWRYLVSCLFVLMLFFCHLVATGIYGIGILSYELYRLWQRAEGPLKIRLVRFVTAGFPFALTLPLMLASPTLRLAGQDWWEPRGKIDGVEMVVNVYYDYVAFALTGIVLLAALWAVRHRLIRLHPVITPLLIVSGVIYLALPRTFFATYMADQRIPIAIAFMVIACIQVDLRHRLARRGFAIVLLLLLAVRVGEVQLVWNRLSQWTVAFRGSVEQIKRGSKVLVAYADPMGGYDVRDLGLVHAACLAMIEKSALVTTAFTVPGKQILRVRPPYKDWVDTEDGTPPTLEQMLLSSEEPTVDGPRYWDLWPKHFDYVYLLFTEPNDKNPDPDEMKLIYSGDRFQLYQVIKTKPES